jgi:hypothetical protein
MQWDASRVFASVPAIHRLKATDNVQCATLAIITPIHETAVEEFPIEAAATKHLVESPPAYGERCTIECDVCILTWCCSLRCARIVVAAGSMKTKRSHKF